MAMLIAEYLLALRHRAGPAGRSIRNGRPRSRTGSLAAGHGRSRARRRGCEWRRPQHRVVDAEDIYFIGRGLDYAVAMEGSLKLKEISYLHSEAMPAGELKHGTLALITEGVPVVVVLTQRRRLRQDDLCGSGGQGAWRHRSSPWHTTTMSEIETYADFVLRIPDIRRSARSGGRCRSAPAPGLSRGTMRGP